MESETDESRCARCGTELVYDEAPDQVSPDEASVTIGFVARCPNPDCPGNESELAPVADGY
ncbi:hypothetical protein NSI01_18650 [Pimelobacter simplex]|nr:hypothetical protein NSI01_18650 [Pimelobacter simplex]